jgi:hypothetical protein
MRRATLPRLLRIFNAVGSGVWAMGVPLLRLDETSLLAAARRRTGLEDLGEDFFRTPFRVLLDSLEGEARLTTFGRMTVKRDLLRLLENRLRMTALHRRHPEIAEGPIRRPLFVLGLPRTGTTILHELLTQDPASRVPLTWEVKYPCPAPELESYDTDPRIEQVERELAGVDRVMPEFKRIHPMGARLPQECVALMAHDFAARIFSTSYRVPRYEDWLDASDMAPVYASHRRQLQLLQWRCPAQRWVLKSPGHLWHLDALLDEYPDACIIQTHRDPLKVIASRTSLHTMLQSLTSDDVDTLELAENSVSRLADALDRAMAVRQKRRLSASQVIDIHFADFMADPFGTIRKTYAHFDIEFTEEAEGRMRRFLVENASDKHGAHEYRFADTGLDLETERRRFAAYQQHFGIPSEDP